MNKIACVIFLFFGLGANAGEKCVFDHVLVTLPSKDYQELKNFLLLDSTRKIMGIESWPDPSKQKFFARFDDKSYVEVWDESQVSKWGYQEACRVIERTTLDQIGKEFGNQVGDFGSLAVVGRKGWGGNSQGGMFFIWQPKHVIDPKKPGIRQLLKLVQQSSTAGMNSDLVADYKRAGLSLQFKNNEKAMIATDAVGTRRVAVAVPTISGNGLVAIQFQRDGEAKDKIPIQVDSGGTKKMFLDLNSKVGTLVLRADQYQNNFELLK